MDLRFDFAAPTRCFAVLFLTFYMLVNKHSDLPAISFLTDVYVIGTCGMSVVISS